MADDRGADYPSYSATAARTSVLTESYRRLPLKHNVRRPVGHTNAVVALPRGRSGEGANGEALVQTSYAEAQRRAPPRGTQFDSLSPMALLDRLRAWWNKDTAAREEEETRMTESERDVSEEDFEARKDDVAARSGYLAGGGADYESDSEPPRP